MNKLILLFLCLVFLFSCGRKAPVTYNKDILDKEKAKKELLKKKEEVRKKLLDKIDE